MKLHPSSVLPRLAALMAGSVLGLVITSSREAPFVLIPILALSIVTIVLSVRHDFDIILWLVTAAAFLLPMNNVRLSSNLTVGDGFVTIALLLIVIMRMSERDLLIAGMDKLLLGIVLIVFGGLLGSFFAASVGASLSGLMKFGIATMALPILFGLWRPGVAELRILAWSIVVGSTVSAVVGIVAIRVVGRAQGLATEPNHLALASLMAVGLALGLLLETPHRSSRVILLGAVVLLSIGILSSGSRSGLVAEVMVVAVVALLTHNRRVILSTGTGAVVFALLFASGRLTQSGTSAIARLLGGGGAGVSDQARADTLHAALQTFARHPLTGQGFQAALATHDIILELAATAGVLGLLGLGIVAWVVIRPLWARYHWGASRPNRPGDTLLIGAIAAVVGFLGNGLVGNQLYDRYIWMVITIAVALGYDLSRSEHPIPPRPVTAASPMTW